VIQGEAVANVWVMPANDSTRATQVTQGVRFNVDVSWSPDGRIIYSSDANGSVDIYLTDARAGGTPKQLTANSQTNTTPQVTPDGRHIVFMSDRTGRPNIWRMDLDGGNPRRLTDGYDLHPYVSPDSQWIVYQSWSRENMLRKVAIDGGHYAQLTDYPSSRPAVSFDGKQIAFITYQEYRGASVKLAIAPSEGGAPLKTFPLPIEGEVNPKLHWTKDNREVVYQRTVGGVSNLWAQPVDGSQPRQITGFTSDRIFGFDFSHDGKRLALSRGAMTGDVVLISNFE
jgi:Tol biopolymer transport system component